MGRELEILGMPQKKVSQGIINCNPNERDRKKTWVCYDCGRACASFLFVLSAVKLDINLAHGQVMRHIMDYSPS